MNFDNFVEVLKEEIGDYDVWDIDDVIPVGQQGGKPGPGSGGSPDGDGSDEEGEGGNGGDNEDGENEGGEAGSGPQGPPSEKGKKPGERRDEVDIGDTLRRIAEGEEVDSSLDDHSILQQSDSTAKDLIKKAWKEVEQDYRKRELKGAGGESGGGFLTKVKDFLKEDLDISKIVKRLSKFKRKVSEESKNIETYDAALFGPVPHQTDIMMKGNISSDEKERKSVVLFFAADTSGSITPQDYESIFGYINEIARKFKEVENGVGGEVYLIEWGSEVERMRRWDYVKKIGKDSNLADGGGTDIQNLFNFINSKFVKKDKEGNEYFVLNSGDKNITKTKEQEKEKDSVIRVKLKNKKKSKESTDKEKLDSTRVKVGKANILDGTFGPGPFLIVYTDGFFSRPSDLGPLFKNNPGNVLYILTSKHGLENINPRNFVYHDLHGDDL